MTTTWTPISKASGTGWTNVPKAAIPSQTTANIVPGNPIGLLLALTYATASSFTFGGWTDVPKSTTPNSWTNVPKAT